MDHCVSIDLCKKTIKGIVSTSSSGSSSSEDASNATKLDTEHCVSVDLCKRTIKGIVSTSSSGSSSSEDASNATKLDTEHCVSVDLCKRTIKGIVSTSSSGSSSSEDASNATKLDTEHCVSVDLCKRTIKGIVSTSSSGSSSSEDAFNTTKSDTEHRVNLCKQTIKGIASTSSSSSGSSSTENVLDETKLDTRHCASVDLCKQTIRGIVSTSSSGSSTCTSSSEKGSDITKLDTVLTNKGLQIYGTYSKDQLLQLLTDKLTQCVHAQLSSLENPTDTINDRRLWMTIQSGLYSTRVLKILRKKGMSIYNIIKAMKLGLINLTYCELIYFKHFKVEPYILEFKKKWSNIFSDELISNLKTTGLSDSECWHIIVYGIRFQSPRIFCHLILGGIDVPGILNWQSPVNSASPEIIQFLRHIGIDEHIIQAVEQYGIDDETTQMLIDLGFCEMKEKSTVEEIVCECSLTTLTSQKSNLDTIKSICETSVSKSISTPISASDYFQPCTCQCHLKAQNKTVDELTAQRNDYLRQNVMVPLAWAMARTIKYNPTDPIHYLMYQLLRWKHDNITQTKKDSIQEFIALATIEMDRKFIIKKLLEEEELIRSQNEEVMKDIPCNICKDRQQSHRIKEKCWKCIERPLQMDETCKFPQLCSSCKLNTCKFPQLCSSCKLDACKFPELCSSCKLDACKFPQLCSSCKLDACKFPQLCSSCKLNACKFPQLCSSCKLDVCKFPQLCSSCKLDVSSKKNDSSLTPHLEHANKK